jgi:acetyltransferase-like isoleucine patch superfamily enzyme
MQPFDGKKIGPVLAIYILSPVCRIFYNPTYLQGKWFKSGDSPGWGWAVRGIFFQKVLGINRRCPFPISPSNHISEDPVIDFHPDDIDNFQHHGLFLLCNPGAIVLGKGTRIGHNTGILTQLYDKTDMTKLTPAKDVVIGMNCRIGMNAMIMPGVILGEGTMVGANSVVTHSFPDGHCVIAGSPAVIL